MLKVQTKISRIMQLLLNRIDHSKQGQAAPRIDIGPPLIKKTQARRSAYIDHRAIGVYRIDDIRSQSIVGSIAGDRVLRVSQVDFVQSFVGAYPEVILIQQQVPADIAG